MIPRRSNLIRNYVKPAALAIRASEAAFSSLVAVDSTAKIALPLEKGQHIPRVRKRKEVNHEKARDSFRINSGIVFSRVVHSSSKPFSR